MRAWISSIPDTPLIASSIGSTTEDDISSGLAPGSEQRDAHGGGVGLGEEIDAEAAEREHPEDHERHDQHRREDRAADAEFR